MSGIPSSLPKIIRPPDGIVPAQPPNTTLCQVGFKWGLNYAFVLTSDAANQIFYYLPIAIADGLNITVDQVTMNTLKPYDTTRSLGFITTLALFYIPEDQYAKLLPQMTNPPDLLWHNANGTVQALTSLINPAIPLLAGSLPVDGNPTASGNPSSTATSGYGDGSPMGGNAGASQPVNSTSVGVAFGAVCGAAVYGAAMFFVARRYRNKRLAHQRSSSVPSMSHNGSRGSMMGGAFMSGGRGPGRNTPGGRDSRGSRGSGSSNGRSVRTAQISAPVMAENSLGWN
ncbi:hypothetical protein K432DRAFT_412916 [Lepidopterella palustris CBS 459.81]|uniref:Uncharacterized protein n=1 Tax=Lepidopterella palustris CBS 459.81 TaxID=1314670 RepID=A0A8E2JKF5_9PEZI|nr:hypothetical protein K432DRAFT_412916 [Lepidopterella palustris CBS 459.81]